MNIKYCSYFIGRIMKIVAFLFLFPTLIAIIYGEYMNIVAFLPIGAGMFLLGMLISLKAPQNTHVTAVEGFFIVAFSWLFMSLAVSFSFLITGEINGGYINCLFESVSGFTTTGATVINDIEALSKSTNALRLFTHWIGGMGILVLAIAIVPKNIDASTMNIFRAEVPGHQVEKFTSRLTLTAKILYIIYTGLSIILAIAFIIAKMPIYDSVVTAMSIAGTGGFSVLNASIGGYNSLPIEIIATVFMFLFGVNMNIFYLIILGKFVPVLKSEELRVYTIIFIGASLLMSWSLTAQHVYSSFGESLRYASFTTAAISSTTGMGVADFSTWPMLCQVIIFALMFIGGCSGSTAGGIKLARIMIGGKYVLRQIHISARPNRVKTLRIENERLDSKTVQGTMSYLALYMIVLLISMFLLTILETVLGGVRNSFLENFTATISALSNVGPAFESLAAGTYDSYSIGSKIILIFDMLAGRLEILPMLFLFAPLSGLPKAFRTARNRAQYKKNTKLAGEKK